MADAKKRVIAAYVELAQVLTKASVAITDYATAINVASEPANIAHLVANPPLLPFFGAAVGAVKADSDDDVADGKKRKREKKAKKIKDPNAPKRPASAYLEFQNAVRAQFREADPALTYSEVLRKIADTWSHMSPEDKKHWNDITAAKTVQWEAAKAAYHPAEVEGAADIPVAAPAPAASGSGSTTVGKDGKEYTGKKRGRKSNAEKAALAAAEGDAGVLRALAAEPTKKKSKKEEKPVVVKAPSSDEDDDDSDDDSSSDEDDSDDDSDEDDEEEEVPAPKPSKSNGKKESSKPKSKKSKTA